MTKNYHTYFEIIKSALYYARTPEKCLKYLMMTFVPRATIFSARDP